MNKYLVKSVVIFLATSCIQSQKLDKHDFKDLMNNVASGWSDRDTELALTSFAEEATYMQPPNIQFYQGHDQLRAYFGALEEHHKMTFHHFWFDENSQTGVAEFTFSYDSETADTGVAIIEIEDGKINHWREYFVKGPNDFSEFLKIQDKNWRWHIGNYP